MKLFLVEVEQIFLLNEKIFLVEVEQIFLLNENNLG